jgi:undecaprenyl-diphosphatase
MSLGLGVVEGLTEFLPVSSTAHLRLAETIFHLSLASGYWKMYTIVIQLGAILCVPIYFRSRIARLATVSTRTRLGVLTHPLGLTAVAFVATAGPAFLLSRVIGKNLESLAVIGWSLLVGGVVMWIVDRLNAPSEGEGPGRAGRVRTWAIEEMSLPQAVWIGACQILSAVFPGTSRSMATIAGGLFAGMSRAAALEFSFLLSIPTMVAATGYDLLKSVTGRGENPIGVSGIAPHGWVVLAIGLVTSFVVAYGAVAWFVAYIQRRGLAPFAIYRILLGLAVLWFASGIGG